MPTSRRSRTPGSDRIDTQLSFPLGPSDEQLVPSGLPEMTGAEQVRAELDVLGLDASRHVIDFYTGMLRALDVVRSRDLLTCRSRSEILVAGVKVATQTPPVRSGRRVVFVTLDDGTGPVDATFFEDAQGPYAATVFGSWLLVVRGELRRTGYRGVSLRATGAWELPALHDLWEREGIDAVHETIATVPEGFVAPEQRRVLVHSSGFQMSPYADIKPAGDPAKDVARKLWHRSPGSPG
jgi:error-prone DNA polymerase